MRKQVCLTAVVLLALAARPAHAYLDPASGSMMLQLVLGGIAGLAVAFKLFWRKLLGFFGASGRQLSDPDPTGPESPGEA